jgi:hypothetical protein
MARLPHRRRAAADRVLLPVLRGAEREFGDAR